MEECMRQKTNQDGQPTISYAKSRLIDRNIDELIGLCKGIIYDGVVEKQEADMLLQWLETNRHAANKWPANILYERISKMLEDDILDSDEQSELLELLTQITGPAAHIYDAHSTSTDLPLTKPQPDIVYKNKLFCVTGKFVTGSRSDVTEIIEANGGTINRNLIKKTDYLIIGEIGSREWIHSTFGRKIEKAVEFNQQGCSISIISEEHWSKTTEEN